MRQRVEALVPGSRVWISTFHSFGARLLRQYADRLGLDRNFTIYDQNDRARIVKMALEDAGIDNCAFFAGDNRRRHQQGEKPASQPGALRRAARDFYEKNVAGLYPIYEKRLRDANALDFDDLLYWPALALKHDSELRAELDARFRFVLIDEYQDTNQAQYAIARGLSIDHPNLCVVVGDPDQSIYRFRGSDIRNILDFERDFPNARVLTLSTNYRSTKSILAAASHLIAHNRQRKPKHLITDNAQGQPVTVLTFDSGVDEAEGIAGASATPSKPANDSIAISPCFSASTPCRADWKRRFVQQRVPHQIVRGLAFFERKENRDILAYLRLTVNPRDDLSFLRIVNEPARGIGKVSLDHLRAYAEPREMSLLSAAGEVGKIPAIKGKAVPALRDFHQLITELRSSRSAASTKLFAKCSIGAAIDACCNDSNDDEDQERLANIEELITAAKQFAAEDASRTIGDFLENITLASDLDGWDEQQDCVSIMTLHAAKGLGVSGRLHGRGGTGFVAARAQLANATRNWRKSAGSPSSA